MTAQELKNSILQLAVHGKLVPQSAEDEPVSELLRHISHQKAVWIKEGKLKKEKAQPALGEDDMTFDIPESWTWLRLGDFCSIYNGNSINAEEKAKKYSRKCEGYSFIATKDVGFGHSIAYDNGVYIPANLEEFKIAPAGSVLLCMEGGSAGRKIGILEQDVCFGNKLCCLTPFVIFYKYLYYFLQSPAFFSSFTALMTGIIGGVGAAKIKSIAVPIPPLAEQERIVAKIEELLPLIEEYGEAEQRLSALNTNFPEMLRKSILQQAVQGKLTERNPSDEPTTELLKRIRAEKAMLVAEGKGKADKPYATITDDELPFDLPDGWAAIRIGELGFYRKGPFGSSLTKQMFVPKGPNSVKVYEQKNAIQKDWRLGDYYITRDYFESKMRGFEVFSGDIIVSCAGTIGESYVMPDGCEQGIINQALMRMKIVSAMNLDYFLLYFDYVLKASAQKSSKGAAIKNIPPFETLKNMIMPLPPVEEQKRILEKVDNLLAMCDALE